jgi:tRNA (cmo5U34)-methyltransferase
MTQRDQVYRDPQNQIVDFAFDDSVADVFPDMIRRSVPGYETVIPVSGLLAARHLKLNPDLTPRAYDLGCSLGATTMALLRALDNEACEVFAVDSSQAMIQRAAERITDPRVQFLCRDVRELDFKPAGAVLLNYVLQFLAPDDRLALLRQICRTLAPGGLLIVSEKIRFDDPEDDAFYDAVHLDYKRANGYSDLEISQKRSALENVMIIDTEAVHRDRFREAGFTRVRKWYQCLNWASFLVSP